MLAYVVNNLWIVAVNVYLGIQLILPHIICYFLETIIKWAPPSFHPRDDRSDRPRFQGQGSPQRSLEPDSNPTYATGIPHPRERHRANTARVFRLRPQTGKPPRSDPRKHAVHALSMPAMRPMPSFVQSFVQAINAPASALATGKRPATPLGCNRLPQIECLSRCCLWAIL